MIWLVNMLIILLLTFWYTTIQYRKGKLRWIFFVYMFFKTNYIWILLWCVTFRMQVEIGLYVMSPTLESFNRPFMRLWFYAAFIQIEFGSSVWSFHWNYTIKYSFRHSDVLLFSGSLYVKYSIRCQVIKLKILCLALRNEKWEILAWYPNKIRGYRHWNPKCGDWLWMNFQMQVAIHSLEQYLFRPHSNRF